jgi:hypothetical protein
VREPGRVVLSRAGSRAGDRRAEELLVVLYVEAMIAVSVGADLLFKAR